jgi:hypothetical protein
MSSSAMLARQAAAPMVPDLEGPAGPPPPGVLPQLDDPPNGNHIAVPITAICVVLVFILYMIRFYAKWHTRMFNVADCKSMPVSESTILPCDMLTCVCVSLDLSAIAFVRPAPSAFPTPRFGPIAQSC